MSKLTQAAAKILERLGEPATIEWQNRALNVTSADVRASTHVILESKAIKMLPNGPEEFKLTALLPILNRDILDATLSVRGKRYKIVDVLESAGAVQRAVLA